MDFVEDISKTRHFEINRTPKCPFAKG